MLLIQSSFILSRDDGVGMPWGIPVIQTRIKIRGVQKDIGAWGIRPKRATTLGFRNQVKEWENRPRPESPSEAEHEQKKLKPRDD